MKELMDGWMYTFKQKCLRVRNLLPEPQTLEELSAHVTKTVSRWWMVCARSANTWTPTPLWLHELNM